MLFNSYVFVFAFLPAFLLGWWSLHRWPAARLALLVVGSCIFYGWFDLPTGFRLLPILFVSTTADYVGALVIHRLTSARARRVALYATLAVNLGLLCWFKYIGMLDELVSAVSHVLGGDRDHAVGEVLVPIGISFFTFNSMSYTIDVYRRTIEPVRSYLHYAAFVTLFPHLLAGPIVRFAEIGGQIASPPRRFTNRMALLGASMFAVGLFKKTAVADSLAPWVDRLHAHHGQLDLIGAWAASIGFTLQLYFDFSAYSDMAIGVALLLGLRFPRNFDSPLRAASIGDFWRRWNMSLTRWIRDYLYVPLGGSRRNTLRTIRNVVLCCTIMGIWHGPTWNYLLAGAGFGVVLVFERVLRAWSSRFSGTVLAHAATFLTVVALFAVFRSRSLDAVGDVWGAMVGLQGVDVSLLGQSAGAGVPLLVLAQLAVLVVAVFVVPNAWTIALAPTRSRVVAVGFAGAIGLLLLARPSTFLYFQF